MKYRLYTENGKYIGLYEEEELNDVIAMLKGDVFIIERNGVQKYLIKVWERGEGV